MKFKRLRRTVLVTEAEKKAKLKLMRSKEYRLANRNKPKLTKGNRKYNYEKIADELDEWSKQENSINFVGFCAEKSYLPELIWRAKQESQYFEEIYIIAKMRLADRREKMMNADLLNYGSWHRYAKHYDPFLDKHEDIEAQKKADRDKKIADTKAMNLVSLAEMVSNGKIKQED
jgi:hypothetical protein